MLGIRSCRSTQQASRTLQHGPVVCSRLPHCCLATSVRGVDFFNSKERYQNTRIKSAEDHAESAGIPETKQESSSPETAEYSLNFLWLDKNLAVSVDQVFGKGRHRSPVTEYFFWPGEDAWEELRQALEQRDWISNQEKIVLLNTCTEVINYWQRDERPSVTDAMQAYPNCSFQG
ncbi:hypothetical protein M9435_000204 [Picochlorum sp. BPE23]|nr:hypothetical protein M9435_000204 [Picochlorum sp. BPE23]